MARYLYLMILTTVVGVFACINAHAQTIMAGDLVLGLGSGDGMANIELARGPATTMGGVNVPFAWDQASLQSIEFDNLNDISHNPQGNLLGVSFSGGAGSGGAIFRFSVVINICVSSSGCKPISNGFWSALNTILAFSFSWADIRVAS